MRVKYMSDGTGKSCDSARLTTDKDGAEVMSDENSFHRLAPRSGNAPLLTVAMSGGRPTSLST